MKFNINFSFIRKGPDSFDKITFFQTNFYV